MPQNCDVLIIGGGPAGSMAANVLSQKGFDVVVLEKQQFPCYKVGESLIPHFWKYTDVIGVSDKINNAGFIKKAGGMVYWDDVMRSVSFKNFGFTRPALHVERDQFDKILLDHAEYSGARIVYNATVLDANNSEENVEVKFEVNNHTFQITSQYLIDASGSALFLARKNNWVEYDQNFKFQSIWGYFDQSQYLNQLGEITSFDQRRQDPPMTLISSTGDWGWVWKIVMQQAVSIGMVIPQDRLNNFKNFGTTLESRFLNYLHETPVTGKLIQHSRLISDVKSVKDYTYRSTKYAQGRCYLIGDAAAFFDPINSEGITMAMHSGYMAAWCIANSLHKVDRSRFYLDTYVRNMETRLTLFYLLTYPDKNIPSHLLESIKNSISHQSETENLLTLTQLLLTSRAKDFDKVLKEMGLTAKAGIKEIFLTPELVS